VGQPYVGQVIAVGFGSAPVGWLACNGQLLQISEYEVLFSLIGTTYGGNGSTTFALPDLRGRSPANAGQGNGLSAYIQGETGGAETVTLASSQIGQHTHSLMVSAQTGTQSQPASNLVLGQGSQAAVDVYGAPPVTATLAPSAIGTLPGGGQHENRQPYSTVNYIISYAGIYPSQQ
jgi:microcystin-dependent protein